MNQGFRGGGRVPVVLSEHLRGRLGGGEVFGRGEIVEVVVVLDLVVHVCAL